MIRYSLFLFAFFIASCSFGQARWQDDAYLQESFIKIALEREYKETKHPKLIRWNTPIKLFFESDGGDASLQKELLSVHAQHLAHITGLSIDFTKEPKDANIFVIFTTYDNLENKVRQYIGDPEKIRAALDEAICLGNFRHNKQYEITRGSIIIPVDHARRKARFLDCIIEEITQLLGLPNDSNEVFPSIFNDVSIDTYLSPLDYLLLKALYSPRLTPGMNVQQTRAAFPGVLTDLHANQDIENAAQRVQKYSLKTHLGD
ncbi:DUF2927 domain-containing protein [Marinomonas sp. M1K-6]|uniref:DUF2927 domain-containing protein n=1 Tax=Marinomonas profundi TaxID=2726122 RepID=A0A847QYT2_9GAMM|nr:DUF2927 domain-containing protein [Marinomonas profundi]NLQ18299.1 DUF2927 domain-containing protein [Marinomonas profundi]UDV02362.1 DUF2927 domain-containing protein [Marinomonas profundi]